MFQRLTGFIRRFAELLGKRYIWSGLLLGFLWSFPAPIVISIYLETFRALPDIANWIFFFPLQSSFQLIGSGDPLFLWIFSVFVGMFIGAVFTYCIHLVYNWMRKSKT
jgi:hypothetical protein